MTTRRRGLTIFFLICLAALTVLCRPHTAFAKKATTDRKIQNLAKKQVKGGSILEMDQEYEKGVLVYEIKMLKGKKEYELTYRASDARLISYGWETQPYYVKRGSGEIISVEKCRELAKRRVANARITSIVRKRSHGVDIYKVKAQKGNKKYEMKFHARTGKLVEYEWELTVKKKQNAQYISAERAKKIALEKTGGGTVLAVKFEMDDGVPVYEVDVMKEYLEYEIKIHARTGRILEIDTESIYD
ncbi:hypothetical protein D3Z36_01660 [Lachnospiraceae bacterium]|nr:hypothetical protein [Lachnospiraceae bacterium]